MTLVWNTVQSNKVATGTTERTPAALMWALRAHKVMRCIVFVALISLLVSLAVGCITTPLSAVALGEKQESTLSITGPSTIELAYLDIKKLPVQTTPASIETGIPCGMLDMCGQDPCLCGAVDDWGACACNGKETTYPTFTLTCADDGIAALVYVFENWYVVALGSGTTHAVITATLPHHTPATLDVQIEVAPFSLLDAAKAVGLVALVVALVALIVLLVRAFVRLLRCLVRRLKACCCGAKQSAQRSVMQKSEGGQQKGLADATKQSEQLEQSERKDDSV